ncbi:hypothetical protein OVY01_21460 [Robbsia sp. Bb-Pol-6]|uniref:Uncharacterized protein n=1 Tax=Robbsia betulipollinis TaxID=2981849 RepID=A0ABT3ZT08_9BURK|nr:hypothetical protein [Robbsia betulipollinis]MCY0389714.1 hypothetical protein [Robbsia betulipollinis]
MPGRIASRGDLLRRDASGGNPLGGNPPDSNPLGGNPLGGNPLGGNPLGGNPPGRAPPGGDPSQDAPSDRVAPAFLDTRVPGIRFCMPPPFSIALPMRQCSPVSRPPARSAAPAAP